MKIEFVDMDDKVGALHDFLEDKGWLYPESLFILDCYKAKILKIHREKELA